MTALDIGEVIIDLNKSAVAGAGSDVVYPLIEQLCKIVLHEPAAAREITRTN
jgi:hypothetical protein